MELEEVKSNCILDIFQRSSLVNFLIAWIWDVKEESRMAARVLV